LRAMWPELRWKSPKEAVAEWLAIHGAGSG
jgi:hypothetical protein